MAKKIMFLDFDNTLFGQDFNQFGIEKPAFKGLPQFLANAREKGITLIGVTSRKGTDEIRQETMASLAKIGVEKSAFAEISYWSAGLWESMERHGGNAEFFRAIKKEFGAGDAQFSRFLKAIGRSAARITPAQRAAVIKAFQIHEAMERHGVVRQNAIMVGDDPEMDLAAARLLRIQHAWADREKKYQFGPAEGARGAKSRAAARERQGRAGTRPAKPGKPANEAKDKAGKINPAKGKPHYYITPDLGRNFRWHRQKAIRRFLR